MTIGTHISGAIYGFYVGRKLWTENNLDFIGTLYSKIVLGIIK